MRNLLGHEEDWKSKKNAEPHQPTDMFYAHCLTWHKLIIGKMKGEEK